MALEIRNINDLIQACRQQHKFYGDAELHERAVVAALPKDLHIRQVTMMGDERAVPEWWELLKVAAQRRGQPLMEAILDLGLPSMQNESGLAALQEALARKNWRCLPMLMNKFGADWMTCGDLDGNPLLHHYICTAAPALIHPFDNAILDPQSVKDALIPVQNRELDKAIITHMVKTGRADPNKRNGKGEAPVILAFQHNVPWVAGFLLDLGASTLAADKDGKSFMAYAQETGDEELIEKIKTRRTAEVQEALRIKNDMQAPDIQVQNPKPMRFRP